MLHKSDPILSLAHRTEEWVTATLPWFQFCSHCCFHWSQQCLMNITWIFCSDWSTSHNIYRQVDLLWPLNWSSDPSSRSKAQGHPFCPISEFDTQVPNMWYKKSLHHARTNIKRPWERKNRQDSQTAFVRPSMACVHTMCTQEIKCQAFQ